MTCVDLRIYSGVFNPLGQQFLNSVDLTLSDLDVVLHVLLNLSHLVSRVSLLSVNQMGDKVGLHLLNSLLK